MILTGPEIHRQVEAGRIQISPFDEKFLNPASYDVHLGNRVFVYDKQGPREVLDSRLPNTGKETVFESVIVHPGKLYIMHTEEVIRTDHYEPTIDGNAVASTRYSRMKPAVFDAVEMNAVIGVGAPWYTSGDQL